MTRTGIAVVGSICGPSVIAGLAFIGSAIGPTASSTGADFTPRTNTKRPKENATPRPPVEPKS
jgi:hypothetical protein